MSDAVCVPNIGAAGRSRRRIVGVVCLLLTVGLGVGLALAHAAVPLRALVGLPAMVSAVGFLQAHRKTCVAHARVGTIEHEDFSATPAPADQLEASRRVASTILRDAGLLAAAAAALAVALAVVGY